MSHSFLIINYPRFQYDINKYYLPHLCNNYSKISNYLTKINFYMGQQKNC